MAGTAHYLYAIVRSCADGRTFEGVAPVGTGAGAVYTIAHDGLAMVVSDTRLAEEYESTRRQLLAHQRVVERVMEECTVLPVRFGTVTDSATPTEDVRRLLARRADEFNRLLLEMQGTVELGLKALWRDEAAIFEELLTENGAVRRQRDALRGKPPAATHYQRIELGELVEGGLDRKRREEAQRLLAPLRRIAERVVENPSALERMVVNAAFLVARREEEAFDQAVARLDAEQGERVVFKYVGPVPPYNFVNITVNWREQ